MRVSVSLWDSLANICLFCFSHPCGLFSDIAVLFGILLRINDVEHLSLCLLSFCKSYLEKCLFKSDTVKSDSLNLNPGVMKNLMLLTIRLFGLG